MLQAGKETHGTGPRLATTGTESSQKVMIASASSVSGSFPEFDFCGNKTSPQTACSQASSRSGSRGDVADDDDGGGAVARYAEGYAAHIIPRSLVQAYESTDRVDSLLEDGFCILVSGV